MRLLKILTLLAALAILPGVTSLAHAGATDPLFANVTTDDPHRANMALTFSKNQFERKHPLTVFLNDRGVFIASRAQSERFKHHQDMLQALAKNGATILVCPMCMKHYGVKQDDLIEGVKVGNPDLTGPALFKDGTKALTW
jgi:sulfur relay (sulfurtransferase) complex TusBCD TusD component (DsrE family)